jgi:endonuclease/exonuclease/phosphatase (EEP) superfamily protein YafD
MRQPRPEADNPTPPATGPSLQTGRRYGIRDKLIAIFVVIKVLPLVALALFAARQIGLLGNTFKEKSSAIAASTRTLVAQTGQLATESSIIALDLKARESSELTIVQ